MSKRYYVYRLLDDKDGDFIFQGLVDIPEHTGHDTMSDDDARSMVADAVIRKMIRTGKRPARSHIEYCELSGHGDVRLDGDGDDFQFDWSACDFQELELKLGEED